MRSAQSVSKRPLLTEKTARLRETGGAAEAHAEGNEYAQKVVFEVARDANKIEIRNAVEKLFNVKVADVNTLVMRGKDRRMGRGYAKMQNWKKAMVTLKEGHSIDFFAETPES
jgi:large subunit ribosomal protein L23